jgi:hypothetical protein
VEAVVGEEVAVEEVEVEVGVAGLPAAEEAAVRGPEEWSQETGGPAASWAPGTLVRAVPRTVAEGVGR